jgi:BirA family biotin operon repressor/biotin-[acetyl-CoA-carboxylase] ligase
MATKCESILFSILIKNKKIIKNFAKLSLLTANVVFKLFSHYVEGVSIKWPNDVYINGKKAAGILLESKSDNNGISSLVLGVGININTSTFEGDLINTATSLYKETNKRYDLEEMKKEFLLLLIDGLNEILKDDDSYLDNIRKHNYLLNKEVYALINNETVVATVLDINKDNSLLVQYNDKTYNLMVGEVIKKQN